jgi:hypothetical protein
LKLGTFNSYGQYVAVQKRTILTRAGSHAFFTWKEIENDANYLKNHWPDWEFRVISGICHGARNGLESDEFAKHFPGSTVIGTDLFPNSGRSAEWHKSKTQVVAWDFSKVNPEWVGKMDFVYSNSLDHSSNPEETLATWIGQLKPDGLLLIQWGDYADAIHGGDCFVCSLPEMEQLVSKVGTHVATFENVCEKNRRNPMARKLLVSKTVVVAKTV